MWCVQSHAYRHLDVKCSFERKRSIYWYCVSLCTLYINSHWHLTFVGPCIVIYLYSKTNQINNISNLFYFGTTPYMFWTVFPSIIRSLRVYIQHHTIPVLWLIASKQPQNLDCLMLYVQSETPDDGRKDRPKHVD